MCDLRYLVFREVMQLELLPSRQQSGFSPAIVPLSRTHDPRRCNSVFMAAFAAGRGPDRVRRLRRRRPSCNGISSCSIAFQLIPQVFSWLFLETGIHVEAPHDTARMKPFRSRNLRNARKEMCSSWPEVVYARQLEFACFSSGAKTSSSSRDVLVCTQPCQTASDVRHSKRCRLTNPRPRNQPAALTKMQPMEGFSRLAVPRCRSAATIIKLYMLENCFYSYRLGGMV